MTAYNPLTANLLVEQGGLYKRLPGLEAFRAAGAWDVRRFGVVGDGVANDTTAMRLAIGSGKPLFFPHGMIVKTIAGLECELEQNWSTDGTVKFKYAAAPGSVVEVQIWFKNYVFSVGDFRIDHNALGSGYIEPPPNQGGFVKPHGNCVIVSGDYSILMGWRVTNSWDNGITVGAYNETTWAGIPGKPLGVIVEGIRSYRCGRGIHGSAVSGFSGMLGGGVSVASAKGAIISNCFDYESTQGFVHDVGAGGSADYSNCHAWGTKRDFANGTGGTSWYVGTGDSNFTNCGSTLADWAGWDVDSPTGANDYTNCFANGPGREALRTKGGDSSWIGFKASNAWRGGGPGDAIIVDTGGTGGEGGARSVTGLSFLAPRTLSTGQTNYGLSCVGSGTANVEVIGGSLAGILGPINRNGKELIWLRNSAGTMQMQLSGGNTYVSGGTWQNPMQLGENRLWVDYAGRLRIKFGQPTSDGDGSIVGTQS